MYSLYLQFSQALTKKDKALILFMMLLIFISSCLEVLGIGIILPYLAILLDPEKVLTLPFMSGIYSTLEDMGLINGMTPFLIFSTFLVIVFYWLKNIFFIFSLRYQVRFNYTLYTRMSSDLLRYYLNESYLQHINRNTSDVIRNVNQQTLDLIQGFLFPILLLVTEILVVLLLLAFLIAINPIATLYVFVLIGVCVTGIFYYSRAKLQQSGEVVARNRSASNKAVLQSLGSFKTTKMLGKEAFFVDSFSSAVQQMSTANQYLDLTQSLPRFFLETSIVTVMMSLAMILLYQGQPSGELILMLSVFGLAGVRLLPSMNRILNSLNSIKYMQGVLKDVMGDIVSATNMNKTIQINENPQTNEFVFESLTLENINFNYVPNTPVLKNISLTIERNHSIGFVGHSGSGKSTLIDIMLGLLSQDTGNIVINGRDIDDVLSEWQRSVGYIPQDIYLIDDTIKANIAFGVKEDDFDYAQVMTVLEVAQLDELICSLPNGIETVIGERGVKLSGGQRQRIGIARALYHNPQILVMDEATAALDNTTEKAFMSAINNLKGKKTLIMIAHRLSTVKDCDIIYFMENGEIIDSGSYECLLEKNMLFRRLAQN
ncbi:ABC transporter ATP-binding protein [uncultured Psychrobacter sp.]|uniref:ABC transporter ATP-binding protein n=1 Tax=uncultured Psychrobacter sp. TaxID=259303 RepID=UPI0026234A40|nr:ABC transporter ATP-binding protein [uncultured Psychrobacter sp.]